MTKLFTTVFVEKPLASPWSAKELLTNYIIKSLYFYCQYIKVKLLRLNFMSATGPGAEMIYTGVGHHNVHLRV